MCKKLTLKTKETYDIVNEKFWTDPSRPPSLCTASLSTSYIKNNQKKSYNIETNYNKGRYLN
jgi:hypothetical protein